MNIGFTELLIIMGIALLLFGTRLPKVGRSLGEGIRNFKKGLAGEEEDERSSAQAHRAESMEGTRGPTPREDTVTDFSGERPRVSMQAAPASLVGEIGTGSGNQGSPARREAVIDAEPENAPKKDTSSTP